MVTGQVDSADTWLYRVGGLCALALGIGYILTIPLYLAVGAPPSGGEAVLSYLDGKADVWWAILGLSVLTDFLFVPVAFSLYAALRELDPTTTLLGTACLGLFVVLDLAVTWSNYASLIILSGQFAAAPDDVQRAGYVAAANYASAVLTSTLEGVYAIVVPSLGILMLGLVMLKGIFGKFTAYLGIITGVLGIVSVLGALFVSALGALVVITSALTTVWVLAVGSRLYRLSQQQSKPHCA